MTEQTGVRQQAFLHLCEKDSVCVCVCVSGDESEEQQELHRGDGWTRGKGRTVLDEDFPHTGNRASLHCGGGQ